jgi:beta-lactamase superfamily II metal-dependent hydrolase
MAQKKYVSIDTTPLFETSDGKKVIIKLLWGDLVTPVDNTGSNQSFIKVTARGKTGYICKEHIGNESLLELYFIDVGQGDGILIKTPDERHIMIDGGYKRSAQQSGKNTADFVDWKFSRDYGLKEMVLDAMISTHNDADHYGGLWDLINPNEQSELNIDSAKVNVKKFYHTGVAWLKKDGKRSLGPIKDKKLTLLVNDLPDIKKMLTNGQEGYTFQGDWASFMQCIVDRGIVSQRISNKTQSLIEFDSSDFSIKVLSPLEYDYNGSPAYENLGVASKNTNGHSISLRIDYKSVKIFLAGDLNAESQKRILNIYKDNIKELACDVAKSCHHGSEDCSFEFLTHLSASATIISSGDAEGHNHPRPSIVAASAITGHKLINNDKIITPLVYSTEISRSYKIGSMEKLYLINTKQTLGKKTDINVTYKEINAGDLKPTTKTKSFWDKKIVGGIIYGLVNVRTDGKKILCATLSEKSDDWDICTFNTRF